MYDKWAPAFAPDPASYAVADAPRTDRFEVVDRSSDWDAEVTRLRLADGHNEPVLPDSQLIEVATQCAYKLAGAPTGSCPYEAFYWTATYTSATITQLDGTPTREQLEPYGVLDVNPVEGHPVGEDGVARRAAWVAVVDNETKHAVLVQMQAMAACDNRCDVDGSGYMYVPVLGHANR